MDHWLYSRTVKTEDYDDDEYDDGDDEDNDDEGDICAFCPRQHHHHHHRHHHRPWLYTTSAASHAPPFSALPRSPYTMSSSYGHGPPPNLFAASHPPHPGQPPPAAFAPAPPLPTTSTTTTTTSPSTLGPRYGDLFIPISTLPPPFQTSQHGWREPRQSRPAAPAPAPSSRGARSDHFHAGLNAFVPAAPSPPPFSTYNHRPLNRLRTSQDTTSNHNHNRAPPSLRPTQDPPRSLPVRRGTPFATASSVSAGTRATLPKREEAEESVNQIPTTSHTTTSSSSSSRFPPAAAKMPPNTTEPTASSSSSSAAGAGPAARKRRRSGSNAVPPRSSARRTPVKAKREDVTAATAAAAGLDPFAEDGLLEDMDADVVDLVDDVVKAIPAQKAAEPPVDKSIRLGSFQCVICMDNVHNLTVTHCGHLFCSECLHSALSVDTRKLCPICRQKVDLKQNGSTTSQRGFFALELKLAPKNRNEKRPAKS